MSTTTTETTSQPAGVVGSISARASYEPIPRNKSLDKYEHFAVNPAIGEEFAPEAQLSEIVKADNADELIKDLAVLVSERGVVFFRNQDLEVDDQKTLGIKLGELSGKPAQSTLHVHPLTEDTSPKGDQISIITSERAQAYTRGDTSLLAAQGWHADITFEPVPSDYAILKVHTSPDAGGDTLWASGYEVYSRLSPALREFLEGKEALHEANFFKRAAEANAHDLRTGERGHPDNQGENLVAVHPVIRVNPVTGWKSVFVNPGFTRRILGVTKDESDLILGYLFKLISENHDLQVRLSWSSKLDPGRGDIAIWDNRSNFHTATFDYGKQLRVGDRVVSIGEKPYYDPKGKERRAALGLAPFVNERVLGDLALQLAGVSVKA